MKMDMLSRFKRYQSGRGTFIGTDELAPGFDQALSEITQGAKTGHWSWYVFPTDKPSRVFKNRFRLTPSITRMYLADETLRTNYVRIMRAVVEQLDRGAYPRNLLMSDVDVHKTRDSARLFRSVALTVNDLDLLRVTEHVLSHLDPYCEHHQQQRQSSKNFMIHLKTTVT